jgi:tetratricopeptide (TPR) repeat protein
LELMRVRAPVAVTAGLTAIFAFCVAQGAAAAGCQLHEVAEFQASMYSGGPSISGAINGVPVKILVDTGSAFTPVSLATAKRLNLPITQLRADTGYGIGGAFKRYAASIKQLKIDKFTISNIALATSGSSNGAYDFDVLLGDDILSHYDLEFDLANNAVRLFESSGCAAGELVYWGKPYSAAPLIASESDGPQIRAEVRLNGRLAPAILDTGASISMVDAGVAAAAGVSRESPGSQSAQVIQGLGPTPEGSFTGKFDSFALGDESIANARLHVTSLTRSFEETELGSRLAHPFDSAPSMLIGADFFRAHHIMVANRERVIVFSYNGGPIFTLATDYAALMREAKLAAAQGDARAQFEVGELYQRGLGVAADDAEAISAYTRTIALAASDDALLARAYAKRGAAEGNKGLYDASFADFAQAIALDPSDPELYSDRGYAYTQKGLYDQAVADASRAIALAPDQASGYNNRAWFLHLKGADAAALPDAERAVVLSGGAAYILETRAEIYEKLGRRDGALADYRAALKLAPGMKPAQEGLKRLGATP